MSQILAFLLLVLAGVAVAVATLHPRRGLLARLREGRRAAERTRLEDALKHLHNAEYEGQSATVDSLAGRLQVRREEATELLGRLQRAGLIAWDGGSPVLTEDGRAYALRVIRSHRLWERYLADHTGVHPAEWHARAERREHTLTDDEAHALSATLGHPRYDPHGDPIPSEDGRLPPARGVALGTLAPGQAGLVLHVEDEPRTSYDRLLAAGMSPGAHVEVLPLDGPGVRIRIAGREHDLEPLEAANVAVQRLASSEREEGIETLADVRPGEAAEVVRLAPGCRGPQRRRLLDLGLVPGTAVEARYGSMSGDPVAYEIRGALIALRRSQAEQILVRRRDAGAEAAASPVDPGRAAPDEEPTERPTPPNERAG